MTQPLSITYAGGTELMLVDPDSGRPLDKNRNLIVDLTEYRTWTNTGDLSAHFVPFAHVGYFSADRQYYQPPYFQTRLDLVSRRLQNGETLEPDNPFNLLAYRQIELEGCAVNPDDDPAFYAVRARVRVDPECHPTLLLADLRLYAHARLYAEQLADTLQLALVDRCAIAAV